MEMTVETRHVSGFEWSRGVRLARFSVRPN